MTQIVANLVIKTRKNGNVWSAQIPSLLIVGHGATKAEAIAAARKNADDLNVFNAARHTRDILRVTMSSDRTTLTERVRRTAGNNCWGCLQPFLSTFNYCRPCRDLQDAVCTAVMVQITGDQPLPARGQEPAGIPGSPPTRRPRHGLNGSGLHRA